MGVIFVNMLKNIVFWFISDPTECPTTYPIQCLLESNRKISYRASFFTSEVDKVSKENDELVNFFFFHFPTNWQILQTPLFLRSDISDISMAYIF